MPWTRRDFLGSLGAALGAVALPARVSSQTLPDSRRVLFFFELGQTPRFEHGLWRLPNTIPSVRIDLRYRDSSFNLATSPLESATRFRETAERYRQSFGPYYAAAGKPFEWFAIPAAFGKWYPEQDSALDHFPNIRPLLNHPDDRLGSSRRGPFAAAGIAWNAAWSAEFGECLRGKLRDAGLPDPLAFVLTSENGIGDDYHGHYGSPDTGWVQEALADPRARDRAFTIDGARTFEAYFSRATALGGGIVAAYDHHRLGIPPGRNPVNSESSGRYQGAIALLWDHARLLGFIQPMRVWFPGVPHGEYHAVTASKCFPARVRPLTFAHQMDGVFHTDWQCPDWYGGFPWLYTDPANAALLESDHPGWDTYRNWSNVYPNGFPFNTAEHFNRVALDAAKDRAAAHARSNPSRPIVPFLDNGGGFNGSTVPMDDMIEYILHCVELGAPGFVVFMPANEPRQDYWLEVIAAVNQMI